MNASLVLELSVVSCLAIYHSAKTQHESSKVHEIKAAVFFRLKVIRINLIGKRCLYIYTERTSLTRKAHFLLSIE